MTSREERLSDLVNKAGGPTNYAYLRGAKLTRVANIRQRNVFTSYRVKMSL